MDGQIFPTQRRSDTSYQAYVLTIALVVLMLLQYVCDSKFRRDRSQITVGESWDSCTITWRVQVYYCSITLTYVWPCFGEHSRPFACHTHDSDRDCRNRVIALRRQSVRCSTFNAQRSQTSWCLYRVCACSRIFTYLRAHTTITRSLTPVRPLLTTPWPDGYGANSPPSPQVRSVPSPHHRKSKRGEDFHSTTSL